MALDRYCIVVRGRGIRCLWGWAAASAVGGTLVCVLLANTAIYGLRPDTTLTYCRPDGTIPLTVVAHRFATTIVLFGLVIVTFRYVAIYLRCRKTLAAFHSMPGRFLLILVAYHACWLPKFITSLWGFFAAQATIPRFLQVLGPTGLLVLFSVNPLLVISFQSSLRDEACRLLSRNPAKDTLIPKPFPAMANGASADLEKGY